MTVTSVRRVKRPVGKRRGVGRPPACELAARLASMLDAATRVFLERGYEKASIDDIADRAGVSKQTIYSRYPTKADLFVAVASRKMKEVQDVFARTLQSGESLESILRDFGESLLDDMGRKDLRALYDVVLIASVEFPELSRTFWEIGPKQCVLMLRDCLAKHSEFTGDDPTDAAEMFCSLCWGLSILKRQLLKRDQLFPERVRRRRVAEAVRIFLAAYS